jgi:hypothetical protein
VPGTDEDDENELFEIDDKLLVQMADTPQEPSINIIRKGKVAGSRINLTHCQYHRWTSFS